MTTKKKRTEREFTSNELFGINLGLGFLLDVDSKELGVEALWDAVEGTSEIKHVIESIQKMGEKINKDFYTDKDKNGNPAVPESLQEDFNKANEELEKKRFVLSLPTFSKAKIQKLPGFKGRHALQLLPLLTP